MSRSRSNPTLSDVATAAGVSPSTASRALNGLGQEYRISDATVRLVQDSANKLGFRPSQVARSLRLQRTGLLGIVVPDLSNPFFSSIARAVAVTGELEGFSTILADSDGDVEKEKRLIEQLVARDVESLVVCPVGLEFDHLEEVAVRGIPIVNVDRCKAHSPMVQVTSDHSSGARQAIDLLYQYGHRRIGIVQGLPGTMPCEQRLLGARNALKRFGIELDYSLIAGNQFSEESGYLAARELLSRSDRVSALFAMSTPNAIGVFRAVRELSLRIPEDISLVAFDDITFAEFLQVPITTIAQNVPELGRKAASLVMQQTRDATIPSKKLHKIPVTLVSRASVGRVSPS